MEIHHSRRNYENAYSFWSYGNPSYDNEWEKEEVRIVPLDIDVSPFDNSNTKKEDVSRTYKRCDGYAPNFAYLRQEGYVVNTEIQTDSKHFQKGTALFLQESIEYAKQLSSESLLVRMDGGNDSAENIGICLKKGASFIIKRNPRREKPEAWLAIAEQKDFKKEFR